MDQLKMMKQQLIAQVQGQMGHLQSVDAKEMGQVVDMIKDLAQATYYCTVTQAMEESKEQNKHSEKYYMPYLPYEKSYMYNPYRDRSMDIDDGRMYYSGGRGNGGGMRQYSDDSYPMTVRDYREGTSPMKRKTYMESKELHLDKSKQLHDLEEYMKQLSKDMTEMIKDATPEQKQMLKKKITQLNELIS